MSDTTNGPEIRPTRDGDRAPIARRVLSGTEGRKNRFLFLFVIAFIIILLALFFLRGTAPTIVDHVGSVPSIPSSQGGKAVNPAYAAALQQADAQRLAAARANNGSAMPTIIASGPDITPKPIASTAPVVQPITPYQPPAPPVQQLQNQVDATTGQGGQGTNNSQDTSATSAFMSQINQKIAPSAVLQFDKDQPGASVGTQVANAQTQDNGGSSDQSGNTGTNGNNTNQPAAPTGPYSQPAAGTILYSQLLGRVDSDDPGPVIAEILQGPLTGARLIGAFSTGKDGVIIKFTTMTVPYTDENGATQTQTLMINALAVDQTHLGDGMATYVNNHVLARVGLAFATSFAQGFGQALESTGSTTIQSGTGAIATTNPTLNTRQELAIAGGTAAGNAGQIINQIYGNMPPTIIVDQGTPFGLLFLGQQ